MIVHLENTCHAELEVLRELCGADKVAQALPRLKEIHEYTEEKWSEYANQLPGGVVRYLLIAEAPPWSSEGTQQYLLDPRSRARTVMKALRKVFLNENLHSCDDHLEVFAAHGFLLIDSIPFAMNYTGLRSRTKYDHLVGLAATNYLQRKIDSSTLTWSPNIRIAFSLKLNAYSILRTITQLSLPGHQQPLSSHMIAVNGAGYPDAGKLRDIYFTN